MAYASWPSSLPNGQYNGFNETSLNNFIEDQGDLGVSSRRALGTKRLRTFSFSMMLTDAQKASVDSFYETTINQIEYFYWTHPVTAETVLVRLENPPEYEALTYSTWMVRVALKEV